MESIHIITQMLFAVDGIEPEHDSVAGVDEPVTLPVATTLMVVDLKKFPAVYVVLVQSLTGSRAAPSVSAVPVQDKIAQRNVGEPLAMPTLHWNVTVRPASRCATLDSTHCANPFLTELPVVTRFA